MSIPTPLYYNSACIFAQIPPRHNDFKRTQNRQDFDNSAKSNNSSNNENVSNASKSTNAEHALPNKERINPVINTIAVACGYDYTVAIQPGYKETYIKHF